MWLSCCRSVVRVVSPQSTNLPNLQLQIARTVTALLYYLLAQEIGNLEDIAQTCSHVVYGL